MKAPPLLLGAALLLWGAASGHWTLALPLALILEALRWKPPGLQLDDEGQKRIVDLAALLTAAVLVGHLSTQGLPRGLLGAVGWFPATLAPLILAETAGAQAFRLRHLFYSMRSSRRPEAGREVGIAPLYFALLLLAAAVVAPRSLWFLPALAILSGLWLGATATHAERRDRRRFVAAWAIAAVAGLGFGEGLHRLHGVVEDWVVDNFIAGDNDPDHSQTRIGDLGRVKLGDSILWRIEARGIDTLPVLIRNGVYARFDGRNWRTVQDGFQTLAERPDGIPIGAAKGGDGADDGRQGPRLRFSGSAPAGIALLALPQGTLRLVGGPGGVGRAAANPFGIVRLTEAPPLLRFDAQIGAAPQGAPPRPADLSIPQSLRASLETVLGSARLAGLAGRSDGDKLAAVRGFLGDEFRYTLFLGDEASGGRTLERFLLEDRAGHCEYFASATVMLLRSLGVPARYVVGYSVQEYSRLEGALIVRPRHAHAWAEAWVDGRWVEVDTTPSAWVATEDANTPFWRPLADFASFVRNQLALWRADGYPRREWLLGALLCLIVAVFGRRLRRIARLGRPVHERSGTARRRGGDDAYARIEAALTARGHGRAPGETPRAWFARLRREGCEALGEAEFGRIDEVLAEAYRRRYGASAT